MTVRKTSKHNLYGIAIIIKLFPDVVIGFERSSYTVNEGVASGKLEVCVRVFNPEDDQSLAATTSLAIQTLQGEGELIQ